jgi:hypothetical protein
VEKAHHKVNKENMETATLVQAKLDVIMEVYYFSKRKRFVAKIIEKKTLNTETAF